MRGGNTNTGANGTSGSELPPDMLANGSKTTAADEDSGLIDIKNMARSTKRRVTQRMSTESDVEESLLASSRPSALRDVVLPEPGKEAPAMALGSGIGAAADPAVAVDGPAPAKKGGSWVALAAAVVLIGGGVAGWFALKGGGESDSQTATVAANEAQAPATAAARSDEPPAPAADPGTEPGGIAAEADDDDETGDDADSANADPVAAATDDGAADEGDEAPAETPKADRGTKVAAKTGGTKSRGSAKSAKDAPAKNKTDDAKPAKTDTKTVAKKSAEPDFEDLLDNATGGAHAPKGGGAAKADAPAEEKKPAKSKLTRVDIKKGMGSIRGRVAACYEQFKVPGTVSVKVKISNTGVVTSAAATGKFKGTDTGACVSKAVTAASFPEFDGPPMSFSYPFLLQ